MKTKTSTLTGPALDWAVAKAIGLSSIKRDEVESPEEHEWLECNDGFYHYEIELQSGKNKLYDAERFSPSTDWSQCGPLIAEHGIEFKWVSDATIEAYSYTLSENRAYGGDHLTTACRLIAMEIGDEVELPEGLF